jgi:ATP-dependent DNA ligase
MGRRYLILGNAKFSLGDRIELAVRKPTSHELTGDAWRTVSYSIGNGAALLMDSREQRLEGIVAKGIGSKYTPGERTPDWLKYKNYDSRELVIGGWIEHRDGTFGVLVGDRDGERLVFMGVVDFGIAAELIAVLKTIETKPRAVEVLAADRDAVEPATPSAFVASTLSARSAAVPDS